MAQRKPIKNGVQHDRGVIIEKTTFWDKYRSIILGLGIPIAIAILIISLSVAIFKPAGGKDVLLPGDKSPSIDSLFPKKKKDIQHTQPATSPVYRSADTRLDSSDTATGHQISVSTSENLDSTTITVLDTAETRRRAEEQLNKQIEEMRKTYRERRQRLVDEAVAFLRGTHSDRAVYAKAANFRKYGDGLREGIKNFPVATSKFEEKLWSVQREEILKSADLCNELGNLISGTRGDPRKMRITASQLESRRIE